LGETRSRFPAAGISATTLPAAPRDSQDSPQSSSQSPFTILERCHHRPHRLELCRCPGPDFGRRTQRRKVRHFAAGRDRFHAGRRHPQMRHLESRRLWRPGQWRNRYRCVRRHAPLTPCAAISSACAALAAAAQCRRLRQARRQAAGEDHGARRWPKASAAIMSNLSGTGCSPISRTARSGASTSRR